MKKIITITSIAILSLGIFACTANSNEKESTKKKAIEGEVDPTINNFPEIEAITAQQKELRLNNGKKWKVNPEMIPFIENAENSLENYENSSPTDDDLLVLAEQLRKNNDQLISSCTMQGEAHEQLHHWLHPHLELVNELGNSRSNQQTKAILASLQHSFDLYHQYFE